MQQQSNIESLYLRQITALEMLRHALRALYFRSKEPATTANIRQRLLSVTEMLETRQAMLRCIRSTSWPATPSAAALKRIAKVEEQLTAYRLSQSKSKAALEKIQGALAVMAKSALPLA